MLEKESLPQQDPFLQAKIRIHNSHFHNSLVPWVFHRSNYKIYLINFIIILFIYLIFDKSTHLFYIQSLCNVELFMEILCEFLLN